MTVLGQAPSGNNNWVQASNYALGLRAGDFSDWRLPLRNELQTLFRPTAEYMAHPAFRASGKWVWTGELEGSSSAWFFDFYRGHEDTANRFSMGSVLAVQFRR